MQRPSCVTALPYQRCSPPTRANSRLLSLREGYILDPPAVTSRVSFLFRGMN